MLFRSRILGSGRQERSRWREKVLRAYENLFRTFAQARNALYFLTFEKNKSYLSQNCYFYSESLPDKFRRFCFRTWFLETFPIIAPLPRLTPLGAAQRAPTSCAAQKRFSPIWNKFGNCFFHQQNLCSVFDC